jgi:2',3'-cyclic-nucleotide 2'-phosphodiesterase / 3'-nucleotidase / 5'-nucleotidase
VFLTSGWLFTRFLRLLDIPTANEGAINGGRVSFLDIDAKTRKLLDAGLAYKLIRARNGDIVRSSGDLDFSGIDRLFEKGTYGLESDIFFTGEETDGGTEFAVNAVNGHMYAVPWMGRAAWESEYSFLCCFYWNSQRFFLTTLPSLNVRTGVTMFDQPDADHVALLIGDDRGKYSFLLSFSSSRWYFLITTLL